MSICSVESTPTPLRFFKPLCLLSSHRKRRKRRRRRRMAGSTAARPLCPSWHLAAAAFLLLAAAPYPTAPTISQWARDSEEVRCPTFVEQNNCDCQVNSSAGVSFLLSLRHQIRPKAEITFKHYLPPQGAFIWPLYVKHVNP